MNNILGAVISGVTAFAATNLDDLFLLMLYFSRANNNPKRERNYTNVDHYRGSFTYGPGLVLQCRLAGGESCYGWVLPPVWPNSYAVRPDGDRVDYLD